MRVGERAPPPLFELRGHLVAARASRASARTAQQRQARLGLVGAARSAGRPASARSNRPAFMKSCASACWARSRSAWQVGALQQVLVHAHGAFELAAAAEQVAQREVQLGGVGVVLHGLDEGVDGLVLLLVEQQVQALEVGAGASRLSRRTAAGRSASQPAQREGHGQADQQPLQVEVHGGGRLQALRAAGARGRSRAAVTGGRAARPAARRRRRRWPAAVAPPGRHHGQHADRAAGAKATSTTMTSGARHCTPKNQCTVAACRLFSAKANSVKKMKARNSQTRMRMRRRF
jgi:hypothetical protein